MKVIKAETISEPKPSSNAEPITSDSLFSTPLLASTSVDNTTLSATAQGPAIIDEEPFSKLKADAAILTSDEKLFPITMKCLSCISTYFEELFENHIANRSIILNEQLTEQLNVGANIFPITEDSHTFKDVLRYVYPGLVIPYPSVKELSLIIEAMFKYRMDTTEVIQSKVIARVCLQGVQADNHDCNIPEQTQASTLLPALYFGVQTCAVHTASEDDLASKVLFENDNQRNRLCTLPRQLAALELPGLESG
ncbi:hypothetical protein L218DRAFT_1080610 [Marasmius fiardii PR-910]|nr:hypothetical protein L218DRAFT_1080610 [Marasmius fiardii PR-910]